MNNQRFSELLSLYLADNISGSQYAELMQLIREGDGDKMIRDRIQMMLLNGRAENDIDASKAHRMLQAILASDLAPSNAVSMNPTRSTTRWYAVAASVIVIAIFAGWLVSQTSTPLQPKMALQDTRPESAVFTGKQFIRLPDGSTVLLNEDSELRYSNSFGKQTREVNLIGEGYFDVQHDPSKPFIVLTGKVTTTVLGTAFNVNAYPDQAEIEVTVTRGRVQVADDQHSFGIITSNEQIAVNTATNDVRQTDERDETAVLWKNQFLILDDVSLEEAAKIIEDKYVVEITVDNDDLKKCRITATFLDGEDIDQVLTVVSGVVKAKYVIQPDGHVKILGGGCN